MERMTAADVRALRVPAHSMAIWWLGQAGFVVKSPGGVVAVIDPYLSDSCGPQAERAGLAVNFYRSFPPPLPPADLVGMDLVVLTHSHQDHLDPDTMTAYRHAGGQGPFLAPPEATAKLASLGVAPAQITMNWPNHVHTVGDLSFRATLAIPFGGDDLTHVGYLIRAADGPTCYLTGDTDYHEVLGIAAAEHKPDVLLTVINGMWRNLGPADAARLAARLQPKVIVPYHYDLFPDGQMPPHVLRLNLMLYGLQERFHTLTVGEPWVYTATAP